MSALLQLFMKAPVPGLVKTRLCPPLSLERACAVHERLCFTLCEKLANIPGVTTEIWASGEVDHAFFVRLSALFGVRVRAQVAGDLGAKMTASLRSGLLRASRVVIVGGDCLSVDADYVLNAFAALDVLHDAVFGPALDGGYVLVGARSCNETMFEQVSWGSDQALQQTLANFDRLTLDVFQLAPRWDIDTYEDLVRYAPFLLDKEDV